MSGSGQSQRGFPSIFSEASRALPGKWWRCLKELCTSGHFEPNLYQPSSAPAAWLCWYRKAFRDDPAKIAPLIEDEYGKVRDLFKMTRAVTGKAGIYINVSPFSFEIIVESLQLQEIRDISCTSRPVPQMVASYSATAMSQPGDWRWSGRKRTLSPQVEFLMLPFYSHTHFFSNTPLLTPGNH